MATTMEELKRKAKAYDEALEKAKRLYEKGTITESLCHIFPELKESDDEKIRKGIIDFLWKEKIFLQEAHSSVENNPKYRFVMDAIAWLEKQEMSYTKRDVEDAYIEGVVSTKNELEKQGEPSLKAEQSGMQILNMWSKEDEHRAKDTIYFLDTAKKHYASTVELDACIDWLKSLKQRIGG